MFNTNFSLLGKDNLIEMLQNALITQTGLNPKKTEILLKVETSEIFIVIDGKKFTGESLKFGISMFTKKMKSVFRNEKIPYTKIHAFELFFDFQLKTIETKTYYFNNDEKLIFNYNF